MGIELFHILHGIESMHPESITGLLVKIGVVTTAVMVSFYFHKLCENAICNATSKRCPESLQFNFIEENVGDILIKRKVSKAVYQDMFQF